MGMWGGSPLDYYDLKGLSKGDKQNIGTEGLNKNSDPAEVERRMNEAKQNGQMQRYTKLKGLLKVIKRGGTLAIILECEQLFDEANDPCFLYPNSIQCYIKKQKPSI